MVGMGAILHFNACGLCMQAPLLQVQGGPLAWLQVLHEQVSIRESCIHTHMHVKGVHALCKHMHSSEHQRELHAHAHACQGRGRFVQAHAQQ